MGSAYPTPGLFSKFFDAQHDPVIEVIRDTVGRHDTFNYACTAKYYEDMGYMGHINCSENFNNVLKKYDLNKYILLFPFCSPHLSRKKWPHYNKLIELILNINIFIKFTKFFIIFKYD